MTKQIKRIYVRRYRDNGQATAYVDWADGSRTESSLSRLYYAPLGRGEYTFTFGQHMHALFNRAKREGLHTQFETWGC